MNAQTSEPPPRSSKRRLLTASLARRIRRAKAPFTRWTWTELPDDRSRFLLSEQVCVSVSTCLMGRLRGCREPSWLGLIDSWWKMETQVFVIPWISHRKSPGERPPPRAVRRACQTHDSRDLSEG